MSNLNLSLNYIHSEYTNLVCIDFIVWKDCRARSEYRRMVRLVSCNSSIGLIDVNVNYNFRHRYRRSRVSQNRVLFTLGALLVLFSPYLISISSLYIIQILYVSQVGTYNWPVQLVIGEL